MDDDITVKDERLITTYNGLLPFSQICLVAISGVIYLLLGVYSMQLAIDDYESTAFFILFMFGLYLTYWGFALVFLLIIIDDIMRFEQALRVINALDLRKKK